ncbi:single-stranded-DNA-specific exonuclease C-terminal domain-containing protein, partial [Paenibacillus sepulcri]|nr:single-stranded-DNA-specific exonuclease C-terminal domain-containing protein [Paenibacillus sepulcri]
FSALLKLIKDDDLESVLVLIPSPVWLEAVRESESAALPDGLRMVTYEDAAEASWYCSKLIILGRPPSADKLASSIKACQGIERVYAMYSESFNGYEDKPGSKAKSAASRQDKQKKPETAAVQPFSHTDRKNFGHLYQTLRRVCPINEDGAADRLSVMMGWKKASAAFMLKVFLELELIHTENNELRLVADPVKRELAHSRTYRDALRREKTEQILFAETKELAGWIIEQAEEALPLSIIKGVGVS